jgi:cysteine desulfurase
MIDFDQNATTPLHPRVVAAWSELLSGPPIANPSSIHRTGQRARQVLETARRRVAAAVGAVPLGVTFTSGGTESDALGILGSVRARRTAGRPDGVVSAPIEHPAVLGAVARAGAGGSVVRWIEPDEQGRITPDAVAAAVADPAVGVVSLAAVNHELGNRYDVAGFARVIRDARDDVTIHVDAVQALGKVEVDLTGWGVDLLSISAHKIGGPAGIGALVHAPHARLEPLWAGGAQERGRRPGTESTWLAHAFGVAAEVAVAERAETAARHDRLRARLLDGLRGLGARIHGDPAGTGNTVNAGLVGCDGQVLVMALDLEGFCVSTGAACSAGTAEPSAVLRALGQSPATAREALRISLGRDHDEADVDGLLGALARVVARARAEAS